MSIIHEIEIDYERPWLYPKQERAFFNLARISAIEATTKAGKTVAGIAWLLEQALRGQDGWNYWWIAPVSAQARIAFVRMMRALPRGSFKSNRTDKTITLLTGQIIWFKSGDEPDSLYGEDVYAAVIDEGSRVKEEAWHAVRSTLTATRGPVRIIGNVKGRKNWFYRLSRIAETSAPGSGMEYHKIIAHDAVDAGILEQEEVELARRDLPEHVFKQLYLAEASDDEGNPFGISAIQACVRPALSSKPAVAWGWDLAKSIDWTVGIGLDDEGIACAVDRFQLPWEATILRMRETTGYTQAIVDSTGVGDPVLEALQKEPGYNFEGFKFTGPSKQQLMEGLAVGIAKREIGFPDGVIVIELESFEFTYTRGGVRYSAPEGMHDDCVCSLALAHRARMKNSGLVSWIKAFGD